MMSESEIRSLLSSLEIAERSPEIQHTYKVPHIRGQIEALRRVLSDKRG